MANPYAGLYMPLPDAGAYLARIGYTGSRVPTLETLRQLLLCQFRTVPFENLTVFHEERVPSLNTEDLFDKIVRQHRGGYCFELNGLFQKLLEALGYSSWCVAVRILRGKDFLPPVSHRGILVELGSTLYYCDVGFGGPGPLAPVALDFSGTPQKAGSRTYRFTRREDGQSLLELEDGGVFTPLFLFRIDPTDPVDFISPNLYTSALPTSSFRMHQTVSLLSQEGHAAIDGGCLRIKENGVVTERLLRTEEALRQALQTYFGLSWTGPLRPWQ